MSRTFGPDNDSPWDYNPYYYPERCGLELLGEIETAGAYEFCTTLAWRDIATGDVFLAQDSGCSCPTPFENFNSTGDLIPYENDDQVRRLINGHHYESPPVTVVRDLLVSIHAALARA